MSIKAGNKWFFSNHIVHILPSKFVLKKKKNKKNLSLSLFSLQNPQVVVFFCILSRVITLLFVGGLVYKIFNFFSPYQKQDLSF